LLSKLSAHFTGWAVPSTGLAAAATIVALLAIDDLAVGCRRCIFGWGGASVLAKELPRLLYVGPIPNPTCSSRYTINQRRASWFGVCRTGT